MKYTHHTRGPWTVLHGNPPCVLAESGTLRVATIHGYLNLAKSNAQLISKTPELLECLIEMVDAHNAHDAAPHGNCLAEWGRLRDAAYKAQIVIAEALKGSR